MLNEQLDQEVEEADALEFKQMLITATKSLEKAKTEINDLNIFPVPDGDTGSNMYATISNAVNEAQKIKEDSVGSVADKLATGALMGARGNSGVILSQLLKGLADGVGDVEVLTADELADGLEQAAEVAYQAVMKPVEGTILTVAREVGARAQELKGQVDLLELLVEVVNQAQESVAKTPELLDDLKEAGVVDAGGRGYQIFLEGLLSGLTTDNFTRDYSSSTSSQKQTSTTSQEGYGYCTEFIVKDSTIEVDQFREKIAGYGDSLLVVQAEDILKVHIHTAHPGQVLEVGINYGELTNIKIDNMSRQHQERMNLEEQEQEREQEETDQLAVLSVAAGAGLSDIFKNLGVDYVVQGGQSMNPSTQDLLEGIKKINSQEIIILPNNKNVISTAEQVQELSDKQIKVISSRNLPQGIAAMMSFNPQGDLEETTNNMTEELEFVKTGQVTYAVRDTQINDLEIEEGDILGLLEGDIKVTSDNYNQATLDLINKLITEEDTLLTIYVGEEVTDDKKEELDQLLQENYPQVDIEIYNGGQPIYYYIISVE
ncbi:DAK2 domain fusion protein YloV [Halobacteroides halobius DSM 5150]|uniref:DAK2 domain fusion protein YloV n=1 Tax=Halobacteroides halobius (strain ATCC 35273 / DSM 5150 / MD-1) TaxID=748449 RepID=L0KAM9_HALHC|nr:DAK2 domain-containing protein [Halobacteroides halobius]AGB41153.1 DAK2 domain fusion protein YloV [Halobacteroides halobius DSM 5150]